MSTLSRIEWRAVGTSCSAAVTCGSGDELRARVALAATVLTGGAAILGIVHRSAPVAAPAAVQQVQPSAPAFYDDGGGD